MTAAPITSPKLQPQIERLFLGGYSLDMIAEQGVRGGWSRRDAEVVAEVNGWDLDRSGRIPRELRRETTTPVAAVPTPQQARPVGLPGEFAALIKGRNHSVPRIKNRADRIYAQLVKLAAELADADEEGKVRERLAELEAERNRLRAQLNGNKGKPINHGTQGGWHAHQKRGEEACEACVQARDAHMRKLRAMRAGQSRPDDTF